MKGLFASIAVSVALSLISGGRANASDLTEGEELYTSQCKLCHGSLKQGTGQRPPASSPWVIRLAMLDSVKATTTDFVSRLIPALDTTVVRTSLQTTGERIAFAPPFGPNLRGVVGRPAGSVEGFTYSNTMMKTLKGMEWTEAALNVWITNSQAWVPGVYMYYKQKDPEIRRKIILYLKANP